MDETPIHATYVLRCWAEARNQSDGREWRFMLIDAGSGDRRVFTEFDQLLDELERTLPCDDDTE